MVWRERSGARENQRELREEGVRWKGKSPWARWVSGFWWALAGEDGRGEEMPIGEQSMK